MTFSCFYQAGYLRRSNSGMSENLGFSAPSKDAPHQWWQSLSLQSSAVGHGLQREEGVSFSQALLGFGNGVSCSLKWASEEVLRAEFPDPRVWLGSSIAVESCLRTQTAFSFS